MPFIKKSRLGVLVEIYYEEHGNKEGEVIVFQHGNGGSTEELKSLGYLEALKSNCHLIFVDMLGYGRSSKHSDPKGYDPELLAQDIVDVLDHLKIIKKAIFYGGSMGGQLGFTLACHDQYKSRFKAFVINGTAPYGTSDLSPILINWLNSIEKRGVEYFAKDLEDMTKKSLPNELKEIYNKNDIQAMIASHTIPRPNYEKHLSEMTMPILFIVGENDMIINQVKKSHADLINSKLEILDNHDHFGAYCAAKVVAALMTKFIKSLDNQVNISNVVESESNDVRLVK